VTQQRILLAFAIDTTPHTTAAYTHLGAALANLTGVDNFAVSIAGQDGTDHYELLFEMAPGRSWSSIEHDVLDALINYLGRGELAVCELIPTPSLTITPSSRDDRVCAFDLDLPLASAVYHGRPEQFAALDPAAQQLVGGLRRTVDIEDLRLEVIETDSRQPHRLLVKRHGARSWQHVNKIVLEALAAHFHCFSRGLDLRAIHLHPSELTFPS
jgi:hypothetical protein